MSKAGPCRPQGQRLPTVGRPRKGPVSEGGWNNVVASSALAFTDDYPMPLTTWLSLRNQVRAKRLAHDLSQRDDLYKDFIVAASKSYGDAMLTSDPQMQDLVALYAMISRMRVLSGARTLACARKVVEATIDSYLAPNKTIQELHQLIKSGAGIDPLKDFSEAAREELQDSPRHRGRDPPVRCRANSYSYRR